MNNYTSLITLSTPYCMKCDIKDTLDELEKYKYAYVFDSPLTRWLARATMELRQAGLIILTSPHSAERQHNLDSKSPPLKSVISIPHNCELIRGGPHKFKIEHKSSSG